MPFFLSKLSLEYVQEGKVSHFEINTFISPSICLTLYKYLKLSSVFG